MSKDFRFLSTVISDFSTEVGSLDLSSYIVFDNNIKGSEMRGLRQNTGENYKDNCFFVNSLEYKNFN